MAAGAPLPDRRRVAGPAETFLPLPEPSATKAVVEADGRRLDGRRPDAFRPVFMKLGAVSQATGSAYVELERTKVMCGVRRRLVSTKDSAELEAAAVLEQALAPSIRFDLFPKAVVDVFVTVLDDDGAALAAAITCASLALADAGIELFDCVSACTAGLLGNHILADCTETEEAAASGRLLIAHMSSLNETTYASATGDMTAAALLEAIEGCVDGCSKLDAVMRQCLTAALTKKTKRKPGA